MTTDNKYVCKKCGEEQTGNKASELNHRGCEAEDDGPLAGLHKWVPEEHVCDVEPVEDVEDDDDDDDDDWKTMSSEECKREEGFTQVNGVVWEKTGNVDNSDAPKKWGEGGGSCPHCDASNSKQTVTARPSQNTSVEMSLPTKMLKCEVCGGKWGH